MTPCKDEKTRAIFHQALILFADFGYKKTTVEDVAKSLGMSKGNLYFYVKNKQDLYEKTISWALSRWQDHVREAVGKKTDPLEKFKAMTGSAMAYIDNHRVMQKLLARDPDIFTLDRERDRFPQINEGARQIIRSILDQGIKKKRFAVSDPEAATQYLFSLYMMFLIQTYVLMDKKDFKKIFEAALELNLNGLVSHF